MKLYFQVKKILILISFVAPLILSACGGGGGGNASTGNSGGGNNPEPAPTYQYQIKGVVTYCTGYPSDGLYGTGFAEGVIVKVIADRSSSRQVSFVHANWIQNKVDLRFTSTQKLEYSELAFWANNTPLQLTGSSAFLWRQVATNSFEIDFGHKVFYLGNLAGISSN